MSDILDLRKIGKITSDDELYLAHLISHACERDSIKHQMSLYAKKDFGWHNDLLLKYVLEDLMALSSTRVPGYISSGEWLCGVFTGNCHELGLEHRIILMSYVNPRVSSEMVLQNKYVSGKGIWSAAPSSLKYLLDMLDDSIINKNSMYVMIPTAKHIDPKKSVDDLPFGLSITELQPLVNIIWPDRMEEQIALS